MSDELAGVLRELAAQHEVPPRVGAAEIRDRARRRSRRRRAGAALGTAAAAVCVLTVVASALHTGDPGRTPAAAPEASVPSAAAPAPAPSGVLDLGRHTLTVGERVMRVNSHAFPPFPSGGRMTVVAKNDTGTLRLKSGIKSGTEIEVPYLVELRTPGRQPVYAGALAFDAKALAELAALSAETGWLGLSHTDAEWFYTRAREGDRIEITSTVTPSEAETPTAPTRAETAAGAPGAADRAGTPGAVGGTDG